MQNLKIKIELDSPVILNRYLTIDSILLNLYFNKLRKEGKITNFISTEEYIEKNKENLFLEYKNGVLSGSIWFIEKDTPIYINNIIFPKKIDTKRIYELTGTPNIDTQRNEFKAFKLGFEALNIPEIYFYVRGNREVIEDLLKDLKYIGKKGGVGFGIVKNIKIERMDKDKSFMLNQYTPAKPLPYTEWNIKSKKLAFYRRLPPYYKKQNLEICYMPTRALIEIEDKSRLNPNFNYFITNYISATKFARMSGFFEKDVSFLKKPVKDIYILNGEERHRCIICGSEETKGILGNPKKYLPKSFNDYPFLDKGNFICDDCLWSMKQERVLGNTLIKLDEVIYIQGKKMNVEKKDQQKFRDEFFRNLDLLKPPFLISLKSTSNAQHTVFKNKVAISNAMIPISFGDAEEILIDVDLLKEAIKDLEKITKNNKCIQKTQLLNLEVINNTFPKLSKKCMKRENIEILQDFWRKYDRSIRKILNRIII